MSKRIAVWLMLLAGLGLLIVAATEAFDIADVPVATT